MLTVLEATKVLLLLLQLLADMTLPALLRLLGSILSLWLLIGTKPSITRDAVHVVYFCAPRSVCESGFAVLRCVRADGRKTSVEVRDLMVCNANISNRVGAWTWIVEPRRCCRGGGTKNFLK